LAIDEEFFSRKTAPTFSPSLFRDPATLLGRIESPDEFGDDSSDQRFEALVVAVLLPKSSVSLGNPAHVAGSMLSQNVGSRALGSLTTGQIQSSPWPA